MFNVHPGNVNGRTSRHGDEMYGAFLHHALSSSSCTTNAANAAFVNLFRVICLPSLLELELKKMEWIFPAKKPYRRPGKAGSASGWRSIDGLLTDRKRLPRLQRVDLVVNASEMAGMSKYLTGAWPTLHQVGMVHVVQRDTE